MVDRKTLTAGRVALRRGERVRACLRWAAIAFAIVTPFGLVFGHVAGNVARQFMHARHVPSALTIGVGGGAAVAALVLVVGLPLAWRGSAEGQVYEASESAPPVRQWGGGAS